MSFYFFGLGTKNRIQSNAIFAHAGLGTDLLPAGVGVEDIQAVASRWHGAYDPQYDVAPDPPDGVIDIQDIMTVVAAWGEICL